MPLVPLGASGLMVSRLALGSWRTYERISHDRGVAVMRAAREAGITFLDDARYNDETGRAPIPTGYSEIIFGRLFTAAAGTGTRRSCRTSCGGSSGRSRPPSEELAGSLGRMGLDHIDLIYSEVPPDSLSLDDAVGLITGLIGAGIARAWGTLNWPGELMEQAWQIADRAGVPGPVATQPPYSLVKRDAVEEPGMQSVAAARDIAIVASYALAGGVLTGKYDHDERAGRAAGQLGTPRYRAGVTAGRQLAALASQTGHDPAQLAIAFALNNPSVTSVLFGATTPEQVRSNVTALAVADELTPDQRRKLDTIGA